MPQIYTCHWQKTKEKSAFDTLNTSDISNIQFFTSTGSKAVKIATFEKAHNSVKIAVHLDFILSKVKRGWEGVCVCVWGEGGGERGGEGDNTDLTRLSSIFNKGCRFCDFLFDFQLYKKNPFWKRGLVSYTPNPFWKGVWFPTHQIPSEKLSGFLHTKSLLKRGLVSYTPNPF